MSTKYPPPAYPPPAHTDLAPPYPHYAGGNPPTQLPYSAQNPAYPPQQQQQLYGPPQGYPPGAYGGGYGGYPPQGGMYYQPAPAARGYYADGRGGGYGAGAGEGICAAVMASLACCCCLDFLI